MRIIATIILSLIFAACVLAQNAKLLDEFNRISEDELLARVFYTDQEMQRTGGHALYLVDAPPGIPSVRYIREDMIRSAVKQMKLDPSRLTIRFAKNLDGQVKVYALNGPNEDFPFEAVPRDYRLDGETSPILFSDNGPYVDHIIFRFFDPELYANLLISNPRMTGRIVIYTRSRAAFRREMFRQLTDFTVKYRVPRSQIRILGKMNSRDEWKDFGLGTEFWIDPPKK